MKASPRAAARHASMLASSLVAAVSASFIGLIGGLDHHQPARALAATAKHRLLALLAQAAGTAAGHGGTQALGIEFVQDWVRRGWPPLQVQAMVTAPQQSQRQRAIAAAFAGGGTAGDSRAGAAGTR